MTGMPSEFTTLMAQHSVIVHEGSGVLIQPASDEYTYVLTANHVVSEIEKEEIKIIDSTGQQLTPIERYPHRTLDAAILKVEFQTNVRITAYSDRSNDPSKLMLRGFPGRLRLPHDRPFEEKLQSYNLDLISGGESFWTYRNESFADHDDVKGCSGGGVFYFDSSNLDQRLFLAGVESKMPGVGAGMQHDHIGCIPIHVFHEIIKTYSLTELHPLHLTGFQHLTNIFPEKYYEGSVPPFQHTQITPFLNGIRTHCKRSLSNLSFTPKQLLENHFDKFSVGSRPFYELEDKDCWLKFLELITLLSLVNDRSFDQLHPDELFKEFKVVYIRSTKSWLVHFEDVLNLDTTSLGPDGKIILFLNDVPGRYAVIPKEEIDNCVQNICETRDDPASIDAAEAIRNDGHTMIHWVTLHDELIFRRKDELEVLVNAADRKVKIQELYHQYLKFKEVICE